MTAGLLTWFLGLSFVSDYIKRRAEHFEAGAMWDISARWMRWGTFSRGDMLRAGDGSMVEERRRFVIVRVPGWYWEPDQHADYGRYMLPAGWRHKVLVYMEPGRDPNHWNDGWRERLVPIEESHGQV